MNEKCCARVRVSGLNFYKSKPCGRNASVERDGEHYCLMHDPVRRKMKDDKRYADYRAESAARMKAIERTSACLQACKGMADPEMAVQTLKNFVIACSGDSTVRPELRAQAAAVLNYAKTGPAGQ